MCQNAAGDAQFVSTENCVPVPETDPTRTWIYRHSLKICTLGCSMTWRYVVGADSVKLTAIVLGNVESWGNQIWYSLAQSTELCLHIASHNMRFSEQNQCQMMCKQLSTRTMGVPCPILFSIRDAAGKLWELLFVLTKSSSFIEWLMQFVNNISTRSDIILEWERIS